MKSYNEFLNDKRKNGNTPTLFDEHLKSVAKRNKKKEENNKLLPDNDWINLNRFNDGYDFGDVTKTLLGTATDVGQRFTKGVQSNAEGMLDWGANTLSGATEYFGADKATKSLRNWAQKDFMEENDFVNKAMTRVNPLLSLANTATKVKENFSDGYDAGDVAKTLIGFNQSKTLSKELNKASENSVLGEKSKGVVEGLGQLAGQAALTSVGVPWQVTAFTNAAGSEMNNAFQNNATYGQAFTSGLISGLTEVGTEYIGGGANKVLGMTSLGSKAIDKLGSKISNKVASRLLKMGIDAGSEGLEEVLSGYGTAIGQKLTYMSDKEINELYSKEQALDEFISGALVSGIANIPGNVQSIKRGENAFSGLTENEQKVLDKELQNRIQEQQKDGKKLSQKEINKIEEQVRNDMAKGRVSVETIEEALGGNNTTQNDVLLQNSYNERANRSVAYNADLSKYKGKQKEIVQKAIDSGVLNNTNRSHEMVDLVAKLAEDKGMDFDFVNNEKLKDTGFALEGKQVNGYNTGTSIGINIDSNKALNSVIGHEITHVLEGTDLYNELQNSIMEYAKTKGEYDTRLKDLQELYKDVKDANVENELTSDLVGDYLFTDEDFVNRLYNNNRNVFQKIYDEIKYFIKQVAPGSKEAKQLEQVKRAFEKAYNQKSTNVDNSTKFAIANSETANVTDNQRNRIKTAQELLDNGYNVDDVYKKTGVFKNNESYNYYVDDLKFKPNVDISVNKNYKLSDILEGELLDTYKELNDVNIKIEDFEKMLKENNYNDESIIKEYRTLMGATTADGDILLNKELLKDYAKAENILSHEIQHIIQDINGNSQTTTYFDIDENGKVYYKEANVEDAIKNYRNNANEIEAEVVRIMNGMTKEQRHNIPISFIAQEVSKYYGITSKAINLEKFIPNLEKLYYNSINRGDNNRSYNAQMGIFRGPSETSKIIRKNDNGFNSKNDFDKLFSESKGLERINRLFTEESESNRKTNSAESTRTKKELDNSSFSNEENYRGSHQIENAKSITEIDLDEVKNKIIDIDGYLTNQATKDFNKLKKIVDNPNETVKIYRAAPVNELNSGDWVTTDKSYAQNVADNNGGKVYTYEVKASDLYYPDNVRDLPSLHRLSSFQYVENTNTQTTTTDNQGRELSKQQQEYFKDSKVRDENGNLLTMYHGTPNGGFNKFNEGSYFTPNKNYADNYQDENASILKQNKGTTNKQTYEVYLDITNPFELKNNVARDIYINEFIKNGNSGFFDPYTSYNDYVKQFEQNDGFEWLEAEELAEWLKENHPEYDGLVVQEVPDPTNPDAPNLAYITFKKNQVKNIDNTNPTSNEDIRYSLSEQNKQIAPVGNYQIKGKDVKLEKIAPVKETKPKIPTKTDITTKETTKQKEITPPVIKKEPANKLAKAEIEELRSLKISDEVFGLSNEETKRMNYLEKKQQGYTERYPGLKKISEFKDIAKEYREYKESTDFDNTLLKEAESIIPGYRDTGRRTKAEWLEIAKYIGNNFNDSSSKNLTKYAVQSWFEAQPNRKDTLNRQGNKYVEFGIKDWVNAIYDGARVGELQKPIIPIMEAAKPKQNVSVAENKADDVLRVTAEGIAKQINKNNDFNIKQRSWTETSTESEPLKGKVFIEDLDPSKITYEVQSNKKSLDKANKHLDTYGYDKSLDYVKNLIQSEGLPKASDVALMQRMIQEASKRGDAETVQNLIMDTAILGTDLGQATQALSMIQRLTPEGQLKMYTKLVQRAKARGEKSFQNVEITPEMVQKILEAYNQDGTYDQADLNARVESFKQDLANQMKSTVGEKIDAWRYLSMLGNPKTHIRNIVSNVAMTGTIKVKNAMARTLETILPVKDRTKTWKKTSQEIKDYAARTTQEMKDIITGEGKYNEKSSIESKKQIFKTKALEKISNLNSAALEAEDWMFSSRAFKSNFQEYLTANGINTMEDVQNNPEVIQKAKNYAVEQAQIATFRQYSKLAATINQLERKNKGARLAIEATVPFKKTPINVAKAGVSYSPLGLIKNITYDAYQLKQGNINASQFIDNISQGLTGTSLTLLGYALAKAGILTGSGDDDKEGKYDSQLGNKGYSVNIGDKSYSISWLSPVAMPLLVGSNAYEQLEEQKDWDMNVVSDSLAKTLDPLNEMSFMQGVTKALSSYDKGTQKLAGIGESFVSNYAGQLFPTLFSQIAAVTDDKKRSTTPSSNSKYRFGEQTARSIMYKIPGLRQQLEPVTDIWGNEKMQSENIAERAFETFIAPYTKTDKIATELDDEIKRVYNEVGDSKVIPGIPNAYIKYGDETYRMSASEYTDYKKTYGQKANEYLNNLIESSSYQNASDDDKAKMIEQMYDYAKAEANEKYFENNEDVNYESKTLTELNKLKDLDITGSDLAEYVADTSQIATIRSNDSYSKEEKKKKTVDIILNSNLNNRQLAYLYDKYYSSEEELDNILNAGIPMKQFIKLDSQDFEGVFDESKGRIKTNSKKEEVLRYIDTLKLTAAQKAFLAKSKYSSIKGYDRQITQYIGSRNLSLLNQYRLLKYANIDTYDREIVSYIANSDMSQSKKEKLYKEMGFTVHNGRVYVK